MSVNTGKHRRSETQAQVLPDSSPVRSDMSPGLVIVYTGKGKGKTTAALGLALRAAGHRMKTLMVQFIKGAWRSGEVEGAKLLSPYLEVLPMGKGFVKTALGKPGRAHRTAARDALQFSSEAIRSGKYDIIVLDEINVALHLGLLKLETVLELIEKKPTRLTLVFTGEPAHPRIIEKADLVTRMELVKHPFQKNIKAKLGIDY